MEEIMAESNAARAANDEPQSGNRPVAEFRHGGIKLAVWPNKGESGTMYNTTISNGYKDDQGNWKDTSSFGPTDLLVVRRTRQPGVRGDHETQAARSRSRLTQ
jgi:hypothetical protein